MMTAPIKLSRSAKLSVDLDAGIVVFDDVKVVVTDKEYAVLQLLFARVVTNRSSSLVRIGRLNVDLENQLADISGKRLVLTHTEFAMLQLLVLNRERLVSKEMLLLHLYKGRTEPKPKIIDVYLCRLRHKLGIASSGQNFIRTRRGQGYILVNPDRQTSNVPAARRLT